MRKHTVNSKCSADNRLICQKSVCHIICLPVFPISLQSLFGRGWRICGPLLPLIRLDYLPTKIVFLLTTYNADNKSHCMKWFPQPLRVFFLFSVLVFLRLSKANPWAGLWGSRDPAFRTVVSSPALLLVPQLPCVLSSKTPGSKSSTHPLTTSWNLPAWSAAVISGKFQG